MCEIAYQGADAVRLQDLVHLLVLVLRVHAPERVDGIACRFSEEVAVESTVSSDLRSLASQGVALPEHRCRKLRPDAQARQAEAASAASDAFAKACGNCLA